MKGILLVSIISLATVGTFAQRVKRKGTTPIQLGTAKGSETVTKGSFTLAQVQGKWQEHERTAIAAAGSKLSYTDTLMINIAQDKAEVREGMSMNMKGDAVIEDGKDLAVAGDTYTIRSIAAGKMILDDGEFLRTMQLVKQFYLETVGKDSVKQASYQQAMPILLANVTGKWTVYRREAKPGVITNETDLVKSISILKDSSLNVAKGEIVVYKNDVSEKMPCTITLTNNNMQVVTSTKTWNFNTYLADNNEFVFGKADEVMHYAKRF